MTATTQHNRWVPYAFLAPFLVILVIFIAYPLYHSVVLSMKQTFGPSRSAFVGLENFRFLASDPLFWKALKNTTYFAAGSVLIQLPVSLGLALLLNRPDVRGRAVFRLIFFSPSLVGLVFVAMMFSLIFEKNTGLVNVLLHDMSPAFDPEFPWLQQYVMPTLVIAALWIYGGFNMIYFLAALQNVDKQLIEAAMVDGANAWQRFLHVTIPAIRPIATFIVLLSLIGSFQLFDLPYVLLSGAGPDNQGLTVVMYLFQMGWDQQDLGLASAIGWSLAMLLGIFALIYRWLSRASED
ncbi:MAG: sugar ABC transporter permease [Phycisphaerales bacterium]